MLGQTSVVNYNWVINIKIKSHKGTKLLINQRTVNMHHLLQVGMNFKCFFMITFKRTQVTPVYN